ncbi:MAG: replication-associated recombination protein A [Planctomycetaceae bacterium]
MPKKHANSGLFDQQEANHVLDALPLAARMRPLSLDEFSGQQHFLGEGRLLNRMLKSDRFMSLIFYGPPGTGKTSLAELIARHTKRRFVTLNAASSGVKELREVLEQARQRLATAGEKTVLFVDELHHFNRTQQDVLLPDVESGSVSLVGATTANPFFSLVSPLISRSQVFEFKTLTPDDIKTLLQRALTVEKRGLGEHRIKATDEALDFLAEVCDGDARRALTALEIGVLSLSGSGQPLDLAVAQESIQKKAVRYGDDDHYDAASALIKSMRGSDPHAATYWLARMLEAGEDPRFLARRIVIAAAEDVGNADPQALVVAMAAAHATEFVGMPECRIPLTQAVTYLAMAPKSNAAIKAIDAALDDVRTKAVLPVPVHLQDAHYPGAKRLGHGKGYDYAHNHAEGWVDQDYLGVDRKYYEPVDRGFEAELKRRLDDMESRRVNAEKQSAE